MAKSAIISAGGVMGSQLGGYLGNPAAGLRLGRKAGAGLSKIIGTGDYQVRGNTLTGNQVPTFMKSGRGIRVVHREFLGDVVSGTTFVSTSFALNPGLSTSFPWLSTIASNFQQFDFKGLVFEFKSTSADALNSTNTALGTMILATQYNSLAPAFTNKADMENYEYSTSCCPAESMLHPIECAPSEKPFKLQYVRQGAVPSGQDARFFDLGVTTIASVGVQAASTVGELWVSYDVELFKPIIIPGGYAARYERIANGAYSGANYLGSVQTSPMGNLGGTVVATGSGYDTFAFPPNVQSGSYLVQFSWTGSSTASLAVTKTLANCTAVYGKDNVSTTSSVFIYEVGVNITARNATIQLSSPTLPTAGSSCEIFVIQVGSFSV